jgi:glucan biosynthesis protein C
VVACCSGSESLPLAFAMIVVVVPQLFYELKQFYDFIGGYFAFMQQYLDINTQLAPQKQNLIGLLTWNHLWFLPYLWCYSILILLIYPLHSQFG